jgi:hypothetical protein
MPMRVPKKARRDLRKLMRHLRKLMRHPRESRRRSSLASRLLDPIDLADLYEDKVSVLMG